MAKLKTMTVTVEGKEMTVGVLDAKGHPIYEVDGQDVGQDVDELRSIIESRNKENAERRLENKELKEKLAVFENIDPEKAKQALALAANLDDKKLLDAKQVETMKAQWEEPFKAKVKELEGTLSEKDNAIRRMLVKAVFDTSQFLNNTIYEKLRDGAFEYFQKHFEVEAGENGDYRVVAKYDNQPVLSLARPGQMASPDEALEYIINNHPQKSYILKGSQASGSGATGSGGGGTKTTLQQLQDQYAAAQKTGNVSAMRALKDEIFRAQQGGGAS